MAALTEENYPEAVKQFRLAHQLDPQEKRCLQNLRYAENKLKEQKK
jgi:Flp pilus assembly protein TadD